MGSGLGLGLGSRVGSGSGLGLGSGLGYGRLKVGVRGDDALDGRAELARLELEARVERLRVGLG